MEEARRYDFVAIGGGNAGLTAAARVAAAGRRVALVDRGPIGGLCSLNGCNPKSVHTSAMADWKVYAIHGDPVAQAKVIVDAGSGRILGAHLLGPGAGEQIHVFALALRFGIPADELRRFVWGYPTLGSAIPHTLA